MIDAANPSQQISSPGDSDSELASESSATNLPGTAHLQGLAKSVQQPGGGRWRAREPQNLEGGEGMLMQNVRGIMRLGSNCAKRSI